MHALPRSLRTNRRAVYSLTLMLLGATACDGCERELPLLGGRISLARGEVTIAPGATSTLLFRDSCGTSKVTLCKSDAVEEVRELEALSNDGVVQLGETTAEGVVVTGLKPGEAKLRAQITAYRVQDDGTKDRYETSATVVVTVAPPEKLTTELSCGHYTSLKRAASGGLEASDFKHSTSRSGAHLFIQQDTAEVRLSPRTGEGEAVRVDGLADGEVYTFSGDEMIMQSGRKTAQTEDGSTHRFPLWSAGSITLRDASGRDHLTIQSIGPGAVDDVRLVIPEAKYAPGRADDVQLASVVLYRGETALCVPVDFAQELWVTLHTKTPEVCATGMAGERPGLRYLKAGTCTVEVVFAEGAQGQGARSEASFTVME